METAIRADPSEKSRVDRAEQRIQEAIVRDTEKEVEKHTTETKRGRGVEGEVQGDSKRGRASGTEMEAESSDNTAPAPPHRGT